MIHLLRGVSLRPLNIELLGVEQQNVPSNSSSSRSNVRFTFKFRVLDRETGRPRLTQVEEEVAWEVLDDRDHFVAIVRRVMQDAMCHEVDESLLKDGVRVRDPHG